MTSMSETRTTGRRRAVLPGTLVLLRHGESTANAAGIFTGLLDVPLTARGEQEARRVGAVLASFEPRIGVVLSSTLHRAVQTTELVTDAMGAPAPVVRMDWRLNERNYGALTGRTKQDVLAEVGRTRFVQWRRSMTEAPPAMTPDKRAAIAAGATDAARPRPELGLTESLRDVVDRVRPFVADTLLPLLRRRTVLVVAHGNSLRALIALLDRLDDVEVEALNLPTAQPLVYRLTTDGRSVTAGGTWLDAAAAATAANRIAREGGT